MNQQEFKSELETMLGGNLIDVELEPADYQKAFEYAKRYFVRYGNNNLDKRYAALQTDKTKQEYVLNEGEKIDTVVRIIKPRGGMYAQDPFSRANFNDIFRGFQGHDGGLLTYELGLGLMERIERMSAYEEDFIYNKRNQTLKLLRKPSIGGETWFLECYADLTDEEYRDLTWIQEWSLAECKEILGHAYSKFQSVRTPTGETGLNGDQLLQEAQQMKERLREEPQDFTDGDPAALPIMMG